MRSLFHISSGLALTLLMAALPAAAQTNYGIEALKNPGAAAKATPRTSDGHPDMNGVWHHFFGIGTIEKQGTNYVVGGAFSGGAAGAAARALPPDPKPDYKPQFVAKVKTLNENQVKEDPTLHCRAPGVPRIGPPHQIVQTPKQVIFLYADLTGNQWRVIPIGGSHSTDPDAADTYNGDSVGRWDGDTLVVDVTRLTDDTWLDDNGMFHSNQLHVTERLRRVGDTIQYQMTAADPEVLEKPWTLSRTLTLQLDRLEEPAPCVDHDAGHYVNNEHHDNTR